MQFDPSQLTEKDVYKLLTDAVVPRPIAWVSTISEEGVLNLAPYSFFTVASRQPPLLCISIGEGIEEREGTIKDTLVNILFKWKHYEAEIILLTVRWYLKYSLRYRDVAEMMRERGLNISHTTIMRWVLQFGPEIDKRIRPILKSTSDSYRTDKTYIKVKGQWKYLYRAVDSKGSTIDFMLSANGDIHAAKRFFKKALSSSHNQSPRVITVDKNPVYPPALEQLMDEVVLSKETINRQIKYLNNIVEKDHRFIKKITNAMMGFKSFQTAEKTITGIEVFHLLRKKQVEIMPAISDVEWINKLFGLTA